MAEGPWHFMKISFFLSGMFSFLVEFLAYWGMKMITIQIRDICRLSWGLAPPWRLSRGGLAYCGLYFGFLSWNLEVYPQICIGSFILRHTDTYFVEWYLFNSNVCIFPMKHHYLKVVWQEISWVLWISDPSLVTFKNLPILKPDQAVESSPGQVGLRRVTLWPHQLAWCLDAWNRYSCLLFFLERVYVLRCSWFVICDLLFSSILGNMLGEMIQFDWHIFQLYENSYRRVVLLKKTQEGSVLLRRVPLINTAHTNLQHCLCSGQGRRCVGVAQPVVDSQGIMTSSKYCM